MGTTPLARAAAATAGAAAASVDASSASAPAPLIIFTSFFSFVSWGQDLQIKNSKMSLKRSVF
jgi:hypothetical protein